MSLIQQFLEQNLTRDLSHQLLAQVQEQNSAVQSLVSHLQGLRDQQSLKSVGNKIKRIEQFLQLKRQVANTLQPVNTNTNAIFQWVLDTLVDSSFLYELIKREEFFVQKELVQISKQTLLEDNYLQQHHEDNEFAQKVVKELNSLNSEKGSKVANREKIKEIDFGVDLIEQKMKAFDGRVVQFNTQMMIFLRKIYTFDDKIRNDFYQQFKTESLRQQTTPSSQQQKKGFTRQQSQKSHISIDSHNGQSTVKQIRPHQFYEGQKTPMKFLQTEGEAEQKARGQQRKSVIENRRATVEVRRQSQNSEINKGPNKNRGSMIDNKRTSIDFYRRPSEKYQEPMLHEGFESMNKTLTTLDYHNRPGTSNMLYTTSNLGQQVRLPTKWASNSRSSISQYPMR